MNQSGRILTAIVAVVSCLLLVWVYTSIESFAGPSLQSASQRILPVWATDDDETETELSGDDEPPTPTLSPTESSSSSEDTDTGADGSAGERIEAAYKDPFVHREHDKSDNDAKRDASLPAASGNPAGRPAGYSSLPKVESPSTVSQPSENISGPSPEEPTQGSTEPATGVPVQPMPAQTSPPNTPELTEAPPQPPLDLPTGPEAPTQTPPDLPAEAEMPSQAPTPPESTTPPDVPPDPSLITNLP